MGREEVGGNADAGNMGGGKKPTCCGLEAAAEQLFWGGRVTLG